MFENRQLGLKNKNVSKIVTFTEKFSRRFSQQEGARLDARTVVAKSL